jgi:hypothetical protein
MVDAAEDQAVQFNVGEVAFKDAIGKHALTRSVSWIGPEIAGAAHGAVAVLYIFGFETPFSRHRWNLLLTGIFTFFRRKREQYFLNLRGRR